MEPVRAWACSAQPVQRGPGPVLPGLRRRRSDGPGLRAAAIRSSVGRSGRGVSSRRPGQGPDQRRRSWAAWARSRLRSAAAALRGRSRGPWAIRAAIRGGGRRQAAGARAAPGPDFPGRRGALYSPLKFSGIYSPAHFFGGHSRQIRFFRATLLFFQNFSGGWGKTPLRDFP